MAADTIPAAAEFILVKKFSDRRPLDDACYATFPDLTPAEFESANWLASELLDMAARLELRIDCEDDWAENSMCQLGPFVLRCAESGYDAHGCGMDVPTLADALDQIEAEDPAAFERGKLRTIFVGETA